MRPRDGMVCLCYFGQDFGEAFRGDGGDEKSERTDGKC